MKVPTLTPATASDGAAIAMLHAQSWRIAYRGLLADKYLDEDVLGDRTAFWSTRFSAPKPERRLVLIRCCSDSCACCWTKSPRGERDSTTCT